MSVLQQTTKKLNDSEMQHKKKNITSKKKKIASKKQNMKVLGRRKKVYILFVIRSNKKNKFLTKHIMCVATKKAESGKCQVKNTSSFFSTSKQSFVEPRKKGLLKSLKKMVKKALLYKKKTKISKMWRSRKTPAH